MRKRSAATKAAQAARQAAPPPAAPELALMPKRRKKPQQASIQAAEDESQEEPPPKRVSRRREVLIPTPERPCFSLSGPGARIHIATSGYRYQHWHAPGSFYEGIPTSGEFARYAAEFDAVELNGTFYGWFTPETFSKWRAAAAAARPTFTYALKASNFYTHRKRLIVDDVLRASWGRFWERCQLLKPHLGPVLFQFPENFALRSKAGVDHLERLRDLASVLPRGERFAFEFRDASWFVPEVYEVLRQNDWCLALVEVSGGKKGARASWCGTLQRGPNPPPEAHPFELCSWGVYLRFHGSTGQYEGAYGAERMARWAEHIQRWAATGREVWAAFNNTDDGRPPSAIADARDLAEALRARGVFT